MIHIMHSLFDLLPAILTGCIIIAKPKGIVLNEFVYRNSFMRNEDGAGLAFVEDNQLVVKKGINDIEEFVAAVKAVEHLDLLIHCRLMSKGEISDDNCHPFDIQSNGFKHMKYAVAHNGTLNWRSTTEKSDTRHFVEDFLNPVLDRDCNFLEFGFNRAMMGAYIGTSNKLCIMRHNAKSATDPVEMFFINKLEGIEYKGCWFSNMSFTEEMSRFVFEADRKRIAHWKPALYREPYTVPVGFYGRDSDMFHSGMIDSKDDWVHHQTPAPGYPRGYGWYNKNPKYDGHRAQKDFLKAFPPEKPGRKKGKKDEGYDPMPYLSEDEKKEARKLCIAIIKDAYEDFSFKNMETAEICEWGRAELRSLIPALDAMDNKTLMNHMLYGQEIPAQ